MKKETIRSITETLEELVTTPSPSGYTKRLETKLMKTLEDLGYKPVQGTKGTVFCTLNPETEGDGVILSAHIDALGLMVRQIKPNGRLRVTQIGGFPYQYVEQENVTIHTRQGKTYEGCFRMNEPAAHGRRDLGTAERNDESMEIVLDERVHSSEETRALGIRSGDFVSLDPRFRRSGDGYIKSRHLDDKASSAILLALAQAMKDGTFKPTRPVTILFSNYEEVGHGASTAKIEGVTDFIAVDMGVVADDLKTNEEKVSICAKDSTGPFNYDLTTALIDIADEQELDYAVDIYPFYGSDAAAALSAGNDYRHALIGPGVAASHGYERTHEEGLWNTFALLKAYLEKPQA